MKALPLSLLLIIPLISCNVQSDITTGYAEVNGTTLYYEVSGEGEPIVLIHGNFGDRRHWDYQVDPLSKNFKVIRYDVRGYGKSAKPDTVNSYRDCDDLSNLLDYLKIDKANICGLSMGAQIAIDFALAYPDKCISLIPIGPWPNGYGEGKYRTTASDSMIKVLVKMGEFLASGGPRAATDYWWTGDHEIKETVVRKRTLDSLLVMGYEYSWYCHLNPIKRNWVAPPAVESLNTIKIPTLIITASNDMLACQEVAEMMQKQIYNSQVISINDAGHAMNMDNPEEFNRVIVDFIKRTE